MKTNKIYRAYVHALSPHTDDDTMVEVFVATFTTKNEAVKALEEYHNKNEHRFSCSCIVEFGG